MIDMPEGWTPKPDTNIDPNLHATLNDVKDNEEMKDEYIGYIKEKLQEVYDPEISVDIYKLGLIYDVKVSQKNDVKVIMTLTSPSCPVAESLPEEIKVAIQKIKTVSSVEVEVTFDPPWEKSMMSEEAKLELGLL